MIAQTRPTEPEAFQKNAEKWNRQWVALRESNPSAAFSWYQWNGRSAREWAIDPLTRMNQGHCSFCDNFPLDDRDQPIEHFKPKTNPEFYHLAFSWTNLYYCCTTCNSHKEDIYDPLLLAPDEEGFDGNRYFQFDATNGAIQPNPRANSSDQRRAEFTIETFRLDTITRRRIRLLEIEKWEDVKDTSKIDNYAFREYLRELPIEVPT